jgi:hypothetical protein
VRRGWRGELLMVEVLHGREREAPWGCSVGKNEKRQGGCCR